MNKKKAIQLVFFIFLLGFAWALMWKTFRVNQAGNLEIATKVWSDFAATIPLIRSFSLGDNFPPQYPLFAGPPIRYHFLFFWAVASLEKIGIRLDWALNSLSTLGFFGLLLAIYLFSREVFRKRAVSVLACIFFLFNGSLSFLEFFKKHPLSFNFLREIAQNTTFPAFAPYDGSHLVSAFWSLNIYTNQRHLALAYASFLALMLFIWRAAKKPGWLNFNKSLLLGIAVGLFPFIHLSVFIMMGIALFILFILFPDLRKKLLIIASVSIVLALPQIIYLGKVNSQANFFHPGYLIEGLTFFSFFKYWFFNLGLVSILAPFGFLLAKREQRKIFLPFLAFFVIGNLFQFSPEMAGNHKFFNLFIITANILAAYFIYRLWQHKTLGKAAAIFYVLVMTFSGIIDLFPIANDVYVEIKDGKNNDVAQFIIENTPKESVFLNGSYIYDPASLAGRKVFLGWPYFSWSAGYQTNARFELMKDILQLSQLEEVCPLLNQEKIDYLEIQNPTSIEGVKINYRFFEENFKQIYFSRISDISIYDVAPTCGRFLGHLQEENQ